jgi:DNA-binding transcriptional regulator YhcF (GntR family)
MAAVKMELDIKIDKLSKTPVYKQVIEQIALAVRNGVLKPGDKLPPERELALQLDIARGTIKRAYEELERNKVIEVIQGSGSFVSRQQDIIEESRKEKAIKLIDQLLDELEAIKFTYREISTFINLRIREREEGLKRVRVAVVDCNPEALSIFMRQLSYIKNLELSRFLLDEVFSFKKSVDILKMFDIIITTSNYYQELCEEFPGLTDRIIQAAVSLNRQTIIDLATIPEDASICILCTSDKFLNIIREHLKGFNIDLDNTCHVFEKDMDYLQDTLRNCTTMIVPPGFFVEKGEYLIEVIGEFRERGGRIISFEYQIERGSMIYIEEQISIALSKKI